MARAPLASPGIVPYDAPAYNLNVVCAAPGCDQPAQDPHHLWRRSFLAGAYDWVQIPELEVAVGNVVGLCRFHHDQIEGGSAWITLERGHFYWTTLLSAAQELVWQPPVRVLNGADIVVPEDVAEAETAAHEEYWREDDLAHPLAKESEPGICPSCKRPLPHPKIDGPPQAKRPRRTWSVTVPKDERENGADVLDELLSASREQMATLGLPYGETDSVKYFVLPSALAMFVQHADQMMGDS
jgi:hypothetical protein